MVGGMYFLHFLTPYNLRYLTSINKSIVLLSPVYKVAMLLLLMRRFIKFQMVFFPGKFYSHQISGSSEN
jgi:hypothetical protein